MPDVPGTGLTCKFFLSMEEGECGRKAVASITTRITHKDQAKVPLCRTHKSQYDNQMAARRAAKKAD